MGFWNVVQKVGDIVDPLNPANLLDPVGAVERITGVDEAKDTQKEGIDTAVAGARQAGEDLSARTDAQRESNTAFFSPAGTAAGNLSTQGPTYSQNKAAELEQLPDTYGSTNTGAALSSQKTTVAQDAARNYQPTANRAGDFAAGYDPNQLTGNEQRSVDFAGELGPNTLQLLQEGALDQARDFSTNQGATGSQYRAVADVNLADPVNRLAARRAGQEGGGLLDDAYRRASISQGSEFGAGQGLTALQRAQVDPNQANYLGQQRAQELRGFEQTPGELERELAERRAGTGQFGYLKDELVKELNRQGAARGGYNSGQQMRTIEKGLSDLALKELQDRANVAGKAQELHQGRVTDTTAGLGKAEELVLGRQGLNAGIAGNIGNVATNIDTNRTRATELLGNVAGQREGTITARQGATNQLTTQGAQIGLGQQTNKLQAAQAADETLNSRFGMYLNTLSDADKLKVQERIARGETKASILNNLSDQDVQKLDLELKARTQGDTTDIANKQIQTDLTKAASQEGLEGRSQDITASTAADKLNLDFERLRLDAAGQAGEEKQQTLQATFDAFEKLGLDQATLDTRLTEAENEGRLETEFAALDAELAKAGIDLQTRNAMINNVITGLGVATRAK